ncbi:hypothetical protein Adt_42558 [Abeliophyllum distichum]|uniref:Uncharacterized protein n=1 Tax=Abeliophyllum distichum TaxID=126358 RepID=A0ABD1PS10_9LAMI
MSPAEDVVDGISWGGGGGRGWEKNVSRTNSGLEGKLEMASLTRRSMVEAQVELQISLQRLSYTAVVGRFLVVWICKDYNGEIWIMGSWDMTFIAGRGVRVEWF